jgi:hypothetical protein
MALAVAGLPAGLRLFGGASVRIVRVAGDLDIADLGFPSSFMKLKEYDLPSAKGVPLNLTDNVHGAWSPVPPHSAAQASLTGRPKKEVISSFQSLPFTEA